MSGCSITECNAVTSVSIVVNDAQLSHRKLDHFRFNAQRCSRGAKSDPVTQLRRSLEAWKHFARSPPDVVVVALSERDVIVAYLLAATDDDEIWDRNDVDVRPVIVLGEVKHRDPGCLHPNDLTTDRCHQFVVDQLFRAQSTTIHNDVILPCELLQRVQVPLHYSPSTILELGHEVGQKSDGT